MMNHNSLNQTDRQNSPSLANGNACANLSLSLMTFPFLMGLATVNYLHHNLIELGQLSEEIFRGDRLPLLDSED
jgi:hypothetical protein